jgi:hypothetical protein
MWNSAFKLSSASRASPAPKKFSNRIDASRASEEGDANLMRDKFECYENSGNLGGGLPAAIMDMTHGSLCTDTGEREFLRTAGHR